MELDLRHHPPRLVPTGPDCHGQATFPHSQEYVAQHLLKVTEPERRKIVRDTAAKLYNVAS